MLCCDAAHSRHSCCLACLLGLFTWLVYIRLAALNQNKRTQWLCLGDAWIISWEMQNSEIKWDCGLVAVHRPEGRIQMTRHYRVSQALDNIYSLFKQNIKLCNAKRWRQCQRMMKNNNNVQHTFFVHFFAVVLHDYIVKLPETSWFRFMEEMLYMFLFTFLLLPLIFTLHWWPLAFLILSPPLQNFHVVLPTKKKPPLFFISRSRSLSHFFSLSFAGLPHTFSFSVTFSRSIFWIWGHDN